MFWFDARSDELIVRVVSFWDSSISSPICAKAWRKCRTVADLDEVRIPANDSHPE